MTLIEWHFGECVQVMFRPVITLHHKAASLSCLLGFASYISFMIVDKECFGWTEKAILKMSLWVLGNCN